MAHVPGKTFPVDAKDYKLYEEVGEGVSATVYRALCIPLNKTVAVKVLDLEKCNNDLDGIRREVQTMSLINHLNVLRAHCSFTTGHYLWVVMPYMAEGSGLHIIKSAYPEGFEEPVIATLLRGVLKALVYLHAHGHIHRDVKAGNILIDSDGSIKLADFGVAACMFDTGDRQRSRNTFCGTPCWMAPEVMQQVHGYDFKADIWSFGITALELAHGQAPFSKYPPMKVFLMTLQNAPPSLDYERDKRFSKSFKELVAACLVKDPKKRPSSNKLLKHRFFKNARSNDYLARTILKSLLPLGDRFRTLKANEAELLLQNKALYEEQLSQQEYMRGISAWNFDLEDLKNQAALIPDDDTKNAEDLSLRGKQSDGNDDFGYPTERPFPERVDNSNAVPHPEDELNDVNDLENSLATFPLKPLQALKGCFDIREDDVAVDNPSCNGAVQSDPEQPDQINIMKAKDQEAGRDDNHNLGQTSSMLHSVIQGQKQLSSGSQLQDNVPSPKKSTGEGERRDHLQPRYSADRNYSSSLQFRQKKDINPVSGEDSSEGAVVQRKGRFKVTSADLSTKGSTNCSLNPVSPTSPSTPGLPCASVLSSLQCIMQQNTMQREDILKMIKYVEISLGNLAELVDVAPTDFSQMSCSSSSARERELQSQVIQLQQSIGSLVEELQRQKMKNLQLEKKLNSLPKK